MVYHCAGGFSEGYPGLGLAAERRGDFADARVKYEAAAKLDHDTAMFVLGMFNGKLKY